MSYKNGHVHFCVSGFDSQEASEVEATGEHVSRQLVTFLDGLDVATGLPEWVPGHLRVKHPIVLPKNSNPFYELVEWFLVCSKVDFQSMYGAGCDCL
jgi:hypothetical protein